MMSATVRATASGDWESAASLAIFLRMAVIVGPGQTVMQVSAGRCFASAWAKALTAAFDAEYAAKRPLGERAAVEEMKMIPVPMRDRSICVRYILDNVLISNVAVMF